MNRLKNTSMPGAGNYPSWLWWVSLLLASPLFFYFVYNGHHLQALIASLSVAVILGLAVTLRDDVGTLLYWLVVVACALFHAVLVMSIKVEWRHFPGSIFMPFALVDLLAWQGLFVAASRIANHFTRHPDDGLSA